MEETMAIETDDCDIRDVRMQTMFGVRATTPKDFDVIKHRVTKFTRENYKGYYTPNLDGYYTYKGEPSAESSIHYTEGALLAYDRVTVVEYNCR